MEEKKVCNCCEESSLKEVRDENFINKYRSVILVGLGCIVGYKLGYGKGKQEAISLFNHAINEFKDCIQINKF